MKHYYISITTQYDGYEWVHHAVTTAKTEQEAIRKAEKTDFTHGNGIEVQEVDRARAITEAEYKILKKFLIKV